MGLFTKEKRDALFQQAKEVRNAYESVKDRKAVIKQQKQDEKNYKKEKNVKFEGTALQTVGVIPKGGKVVIRLNPDTEILSLNYNKDISVKLPYSRVMGFRLEAITEETANNKTDLAGLVLSSGMLGRGIVGQAGRIAGNMLMGIKKRKAIWVGTLVYQDKNGNTQEISFAGNEQELERDDSPFKYSDDEQFELAVNRVALRTNQDLLEL